MSVELYRESPGKFDSRTLSRKTLHRWTGRSTFQIMFLFGLLQNTMYRTCLDYFREFTKGGLVKGGLAIYVLILCYYC